MSSMKSVMSALALCVSVLVAACTPIQHKAYDGPPVGPNETAVLSVDRATVVQSVDGRPTGIKGYNPGEFGADLALLPGRRVISVSYGTFDGAAFVGTKGVISVEYDFKAGRRYELHYTAAGVFRPTIVDVSQSGSKKGALAGWGKL